MASSSRRPKPIIPVHDVAHLREIRQQIRSQGFETSLSKRGDIQLAHLSPNHRVSHETLERLCAYDPRSAAKIDYRIIRALTARLRLSKTTAILDDKFQNVRHEDSKYYLEELSTLGNRVKFSTQDALAKQIGVSRQHLNEQIRILSELFVIVDKGHGYIELNPNVFWTGQLNHQTAYCLTYFLLEWDDAGLPTLYCPLPRFSRPLARLSTKSLVK